MNYKSIDEKGKFVISEEAQNGMKIVADAGDTKFPHLCVYNSLAITGSAAEGIEGLIAIYRNLMGFNG